ncbi:MAG: glycosyltransferase [Alphaproteobacteria bacterium]|nr:glycosyltransferase [Alphaproteobacteria bacterium]
MFRAVIIIPCFNHADAFVTVANKLDKYKLPVIVIDDGSETNQSKKIKSTCQKYNYMYVKHDKNSGKGAAMLTGFRQAAQKGFSNALQIDADGQHDINDIPKFIKLAQKHPNALIVGQPVYDSSAPKSRLIGRKITDFWVAIETLNPHMPDAMCGFRVYPVKETNTILSSLCFMRMGFDIEILVKLYRMGINIITTQTRVTYPKSGVSHFRVWHDNFYISLLHTYLFFGLPLWLLNGFAGKIKNLFLVFVLFCGTANAKNITQMPDTLKTFTDNLGTVSAAYTQSKTLPESTKIFHARGVVKFVKDSGFKWKQLDPNSFDFTSTLDTYCVNGSPETLSSLPYFSQIQSMIKDMLDGDMNDFLTAFDADYTESKKGQNWTLLASPKISAISDFLESMTMTGNKKDLTQIVIKYKNGTKIVLDFRRLKTDLTDEIEC